MPLRGHCKVPSCSCAAFDGEQTADAPEEDTARHIYIARATDATGSKGVEVRAIGIGSMGDQAEQAMKSEPKIAITICEEAERRFMEMTNGEEPAYSGTSLLPYMAELDDGD
jgi:hypothetical protein